MLVLVWFSAMTPTLMPEVLLSSVLKVSFMVGMRVGLLPQRLSSRFRHQAIDPESSNMNSTFGRMP
ncbi:hypothetical protein D3C76_1744510 [compost metagenome]